MTTRLAAAALLLCMLAGCSSLLPKSKEVTASPWQTYQDAQNAFDKIVPGHTTIADLRAMDLDPSQNANIAILNYADVMRKFMLNQSFSINDLDQGVRECVMAKVLCRGFEVTQSNVQKSRNGNVMLDVLGFYRETHTTGWRFNGLILIKENVVIYKLTGGQPVIQGTEENKNRQGNVVLDVLGFYRETQTSGWRFNGLILVKEGVVVYKLTGGQPAINQSEENSNPLGPVQSIGSKLLGGWL